MGSNGPGFGPSIEWERAGGGGFRKGQIGLEISLYRIFRVIRFDAWLSRVDCHWALANVQARVVVFITGRSQSVREAVIHLAVTIKEDLFTFKAGWL